MLNKSPEGALQDNTCMGMKGSCRPRRILLRRRAIMNKAPIITPSAGVRGIFPNRIAALNSPRTNEALVTLKFDDVHDLTSEG